MGAYRVAEGLVRGGFAQLMPEVQMRTPAASPACRSRGGRDFPARRASSVSARRRPLYPGRMRILCGLIAIWMLGGCATAKPAGRPDEWRLRLARAMREDVPTREKRDALSRTLVDAVDAGAVEGMSMAELDSAFGPGISCAGDALCDREGFSANDRFYPIGHSDEPSIKQLPVLIIGFTPHGYVGRVFTLKTH